MSKTLLLADDSVTIQRVVELSFAHEDVRIVAVNDGERAMQWLESDRPDVVLVDVAVPEVDGYAIAKHIKKSKRLGQVPVLLMSGAFESVDEEKAKSIGCDGIIVKPFEPRHLVERVMELLGRGETGAEEPAPAAAADPRPPARAAGPKRVVSEPKLPSGAARDELARQAAAELAEEERLMPLDLPTEPVELELPSRPPWATEVAPGRTAPPEPPPPPAAAKTKGSMVNAFSALLAAEKAGRDSAPAVPSGTAVSDDALEAAVRRVLERLTGDQVRKIVLETAERLIREEIEKIKADSE